MPLQATSGAASYDGFGGGVAAVPNYIEDVFSTYLYTGTSATQSINNGIDLATKGGLVWGKGRSVASEHALFDTSRGVNKFLQTQSTSAETTYAGTLTAFNSNGFSLGTDGVGVINASGTTYASWTFRKQPKFFDIQTATVGASNTLTFSHSLGSTPGFIMVKTTANAGGWVCYHTSLGNNKILQLQSTAAAVTVTGAWTVSSTSVTLTGAIGTGEAVVAYLYAHNAGGFGLTGTDNVISCGSFTSDGSSPISVNLGYEPQWVLVKASTASGYDWWLFDNMRGTPVGSGPQMLRANTSSAENTSSSSAFQPNATGFTADGSWLGVSTFIYIAIRRGPMKVPTDATKVFIPVSTTPSGSTTVTTNFPVDLAINAQRDAGTSGNKVFWDRLRGSSTAAGQGLFSTLTNAEVSYSGNGIGLQSNTTIIDNYWNTLNGATTPVIYWNLRRAPSFFDEVCYTGTGVTHTETHNLGVAPELIIVKRRASATASWAVYAAPLTASYVGFLDLTNAFQADNMWNSTAPTSTAFTVRAANAQVNASGSTYVAYLFATCAGVSKVGSYTGTGTTLQVNCGFTGGSRFVLIKRTDASADWYVWDSARGIVAGNDPYLLMNSSAAEVTSTDYIDTYSAGFEISSTAPAAINASGGTFIFLAIA